MLKSTLFCVMALLCLNFLGYGQAKELTAGGLQVGQVFPDMMVPVIGYDQDEISINQRAGKITILDFWATWCSPCLAMLPRMDSLQRLHGDKVQFISVAYQRSAEVVPFLADLEKRQGRRYNIPIITDDKTLVSVFPHHTLPHYVWLKDGKVSAITGLEQVNESNLLSMYNSEVSLAAKKDFTVDFDDAKPLFITGNGGDGSSLSYYSMLSGKVEGLPARHANLKADEGGKRIIFTNVGLPILFKTAFSRSQEYFSNNRVIYKVRDSLPFFLNKSVISKQEWQSKYIYCYELLVPLAQQDRAWDLVRADFTRYFPQYVVSKELQSMKCYVLSKKRAFKALPVSSGPRKLLVNADGVSMRNQSLGVLLRQLNTSYLQDSAYPVVDGTGIVSGLDLDLSANMNEIGAINLALARYGLEFKLTDKRIEVLVIGDAKGSNDKTK